MAEIELRDVVKRFGTVTAVDRINLTVEDKEFIALVGPSGCGKTTTLRMIAGLEELLARKPKELSGGQRQRVAMGRAIVRKPRAFLFDEPLSNLDAKLRVQMRGELAKLHEQLETTIVYVTHDQIEAMTLAERIVVMKDGIIMQIGTALEVYNNPKNIFVAGFIGSPAMNFLDVHVREENGSFFLAGETFRLQVPKGLEGRYLKAKGKRRSWESGHKISMIRRSEDRFQMGSPCMRLLRLLSQ